MWVTTTGPSDHKVHAASWFSSPCLNRSFVVDVVVFLRAHLTARGIRRKRPWKTFFLDDCYFSCVPIHTLSPPWTIAWTFFSSSCLLSRAYLAPQIIFLSSHPHSSASLLLRREMCCFEDLTRDERSRSATKDCFSSTKIYTAKGVN